MQQMKRGKHTSLGRKRCNQWGHHNNDGHSDGAGKLVVEEEEEEDRRYYWNTLDSLGTPDIAAAAEGSPPEAAVGPTGNQAVVDRRIRTL